MSNVKKTAKQNVPAEDVQAAVAAAMQKLIAQVPPAQLHAYTAAPGDVDVRQAVADYVKKTYGFGAEAKYVYMTSGASSSLAITLHTVAEEGDEVIVFTPYFRIKLTTQSTRRCTG